MQQGVMVQQAPLLRPDAYQKQRGQHQEQKLHQQKKEDEREAGITPRHFAAASIQNTNFLKADTHAQSGYFASLAPNSSNSSKRSRKVRSAPLSPYSLDRICVSRHQGQLEKLHFCVWLPCSSTLMPANGSASHLHGRGGDDRSWTSKARAESLNKKSSKEGVLRRLRPLGQQVLKRSSVLFLRRPSLLLQRLPSLK